MLFKEQPISRKERKLTQFALQAVLLSDVVIESRLLGFIEYSVVLGTGKVLAVLLMILPDGLLRALEHLKAHAAVVEAVALDQVRTVVTDQVVVGKVKRASELELASETTLLIMRSDLVMSHLA